MASTPENRHPEPAAPAGVPLLIIDDDVELCELLTEYLTAAGFTVAAVHDGEAGLRRAHEGRYALIVLDVMLPGCDGFEVLRRLRATSSLPVLMLTARGDDVDRIVGLELGADDYLPKPFNPRELLARVQAILRRVRAPAPAVPTAGEHLTLGDITMDLGARQVRRGAAAVDLTGAEFLLLETLLRAAGHVVEREELSRRVLGRRLMPFDRSIDMHVSNLRKKLGPGPGDAERIKTVRGMGYILTLPAEPGLALDPARPHPPQ
jgi:DNA-binding response OmpR family regulator